MPKTQLKLNKWLRGIANHNFEIKNREQIFCKACNCIVNSQQKCLLEQHIRTKTHQSLALQYGNEETENFEETSSTKEEFFNDLCLAMVSINAAWNTLNNPVWRGFLEKYTKMHIPDESTVRKNYLNKVHLQTIKCIRENIGENFVWISVDETTDSTGRHMGNFIVGKMCCSSPSEPYLLHCKELYKVNFSTIANFVTDCILSLWPKGNNREKVLLLVTDGAAYMVKAADYLKVYYPNLKHLTCLVHAIHRVAEEIRDSFPSVDFLISTTKKVFLKSPSRVAKYKEVSGNAPLPPNPVITRWGSWIGAAVFFSENFFKIKEAIESLNPKDAKSIRKAQTLVKDENTFHDLLCIANNFSTLPDTITKLETKGMPLCESMTIFGKFVEDIKQVPGNIGQTANQKLRYLLNKNSMFEELWQLSLVLKGSADKTDKISIDKKFWCLYKYAPISSVDVERSFSSFQNVFQDKRQRFTSENIEKVVVVYFNKHVIPSQMSF